jgi:hypothetical protein
MKEYIVIKIILFMLNTGVKLKEDDLSITSRCHIFNLAKSIVKYSHNDSDISALLSIGYKESKFNYNGIKWFTSPNGKHCGIYQQSPQFAILNGKKLSCKDLQSSDTSTEQALNYINHVLDTYGNKWENICHYNSGNNCNNGSRRYAKDFKSKYDKINKMMKGNNKDFNNFVISDYESLETICSNQ